MGIVSLLCLFIIFFYFVSLFCLFILSLYFVSFLSLNPFYQRLKNSLHLPYTKNKGCKVRNVANFTVKKTFFLQFLTPKIKSIIKKYLFFKNYCNELYIYIYFLANLSYLHSLTPHFFFLHFFFLFFL